MKRSTPSFFPPARDRVHEVCGAGVYGFAFALLAQCGGRAIWVREAWRNQQINPSGFADYLDPSRLTICNTSDQTETLAVAEEALRSGAVSLVVMVLGKSVGLTEGRRLQLAAKQGETRGLAIIPEGMGSNAAETRWRCTPVFETSDADKPRRDSTLQCWELIKNKSGTLGIWHVRWDAASRRFNMVSPVGE